MNAAIEVHQNNSEPQGASNPGFIELTTDIIVFGYMAAWYASSGITPKPAMPGWGVEYKHKMIVVKSTAFTAAITVRNKVLGMSITSHEGHNAVKGPKRTAWIPMTAFANATLKIQGEWLD